MVLLHVRPDVEREGTRQGDREVIKLREAGEQRGTDESVGASDEGTAQHLPPRGALGLLALVSFVTAAPSSLSGVRWIPGDEQVQTGGRTVRRGQGGSAGGAHRLRWLLGHGIRGRSGCKRDECASVEPGGNT